MINLERALLEYKKDPTVSPFDICKVPILAEPEDVSKKLQSQSGPKSISAPLVLNIPSLEAHSALLASIPQFATLGPIFKSSKPAELTESETEYVVSCVKHVLSEFIVFQFSCTNTLKDQLLENVTAKMDISSIKELKVESLVPLPSLSYGSSAPTFVCVKKQRDSFPIGVIPSALKFLAKEIDSSGEAEETGHEDEYQVEDVELLICDYMQQTFVSNFQEKWDQIGDEFEVVQTYSLNTSKSLQDAVNEVITFLGMQACDRTDKVPAKKSKHILLLSGNFIGGIPVLVRSRMKFVEGQGVQMELTVRSGNDDVSTSIASAM